MLNMDNSINEITFKLKQYASLASMGNIVVSSKTKPIVGTTALDTCYGLVFYDRQNQKGIVGHATPSDKFKILSDMLKLLEKDKKQVIEYAFVSGYRIMMGL